ncbi:GNAT family N-acetyltransferase [Parasalinivibrio latis]|uniref:GNAT family N-acetyltransferase n=1 Tax=Parasalinivibrio latis TaxID=2952610 RepID=UPI0030E2CF6A
MEVQSHIREATEKDAEGLQRCMEQAYALYVPRLGGQLLPPQLANYEEEISNYPVWVIEANGEIAAGLVMHFENKQASLMNIAVSPDFQGQGFGKALMIFAENQAKERDCEVMELATHYMLVENVALYQRAGWETYDMDDLRIYMKKTLV